MVSFQVMCVCILQEFENIECEQKDLLVCIMSYQHVIATKTDEKHLESMHKQI